MKQNLYYRNVLRRENIITQSLFNFGLKVASYPRKLIEVFIRKNFGERYFSMATALTLLFILICLPILINGGIPSDSNAAYYEEYGLPHPPSFFGRFATWYLFTIGFGYFSLLRRKEIKASKSSFDFGRFSLSSGELHPFFRNLKINDRTFNIRIIEIIAEPLPFLVTGSLLILISQPIGWVMLIVSILYSLSYAAAYQKGDEFILDMIDERIMNEELEHGFLNDEGSEQTRGVRFYMRKPSDDKQRSKLAQDMVEGDEITDVL